MPETWPASELNDLAAFYQPRGLAWLAARDVPIPGSAAVLADDMGLGKTIQIIALHLLRPRPQGGTDARGLPRLAAA